MKKIFFTIVLSITTSTLVHAKKLSDPNIYLSLVCKQEGERYPLSIILRKLHNLPIDKQKENIKYPYQIEIKEIRPLWQEILIIPTIFQGKLEFEDVVTRFNSNDGRARLAFYADELNETSLRIDQTKSTLDCRYIE